MPGQIFKIQVYLSVMLTGDPYILKASVADLFECVEHIFYCKFIVQGRAVE